MQRFIMFLQKYNFVVNYVPRKDLIDFSILSKAPHKEQYPELSEEELNCQDHSVISSFPISTEILKNLEVETLNDRTPQRIASYVAQG